MGVTTPPRLASSLPWRNNGPDSVSNHQPHDCLLNRLFGRGLKKTSKLRVTGLCAGNSPGTGEFPAQMASNVENVSIWWRHHDMPFECPANDVMMRSLRLYWQQRTDNNLLWNNYWDGLMRIVNSCKEAFDEKMVLGDNLIAYQAVMAIFFIMKYVWILLI